MFLCSECDRSARVLYARYFSDRIWFFSCRKCADITYQSTMGHRWDRSARRVEKLRARLQWSANATVPIKPRGMHERTYQRILGALTYHEAIRQQGTSYARKDRPALICGGNVEVGSLIFTSADAMAPSTRRARRRQGCRTSWTSDHFR
jgi:hypothetical protein